MSAEVVPSPYVAHVLKRTQNGNDVSWSEAGWLGHDHAYSPPSAEKIGAAFGEGTFLVLYDGITTRKDRGGDEVVRFAQLITFEEQADDEGDHRPAFDTEPPRGEP